MRPGEEITAEGLWGDIAKRGAHRFFLHDQIAGRTWRCLVPDALLLQALDACHRRVEITGTVRDSGRVLVTAINPFPQAHQIPSVADMRDLLAP